MENSKKEFISIVEVYMQLENVYSGVNQKINVLKNTCQDFIKTHSGKQIFIFCLDSWQFQCKIIDVEFDDMKRLLSALNNRMYCEYYKLYKLVLDYVYKEEILERGKQQKEFPIYKDLEPFKQYNLDIIQDVHESIIELLVKILEYINIKEIELKKHQQKQEKGFNMQNFVLTFNDILLSIKQKLGVFISYMNFFHSMHLRYLKRLLTKLTLFESQLIKDIRFDEELTCNDDMIRTIQLSSISSSIELEEITKNIYCQITELSSDTDNTCINETNHDLNLDTDEITSNDSKNDYNILQNLIEPQPQPEPQPEPKTKPKTKIKNDGKKKPFTYSRS